MAEPEVDYKKLKRLALEDPKGARQEFLRLLEDASPQLEEVLVLAANPGESRIRQTVANAIRTHPDKSKIVPHLLKWRSIEVDEFAIRAIDAAIADIDQRSSGSSKPRNMGSALQVSEMYRYVSDRLRHKLRNAMLGVQNQSIEVREAIRRGETEVVPSHIAKLNDSILVIGRMLEAADVDPSYFEQKPVVLSGWLLEMNKRYASQYEGVELALLGDVDVKITASEYLLETAFWNIWVNAQQAIGSGCKINVTITDLGTHARILILDNGTGFPVLLKGIAFSQSYSSKHPSRGRGLLEIQDAIERLNGSINLLEVSLDELRLEIKIPTIGRKTK